MPGKVVVSVHELSSVPMEVTAGEKKEIVQPAATREFEGDDIQIKAAPQAAENPEPPASAGQDVFDHGNPNGIVRAEIAPKIPKAAGEQAQRVTEDGRVLEEVIKDGFGIAAAGGGPEGAESGKTPGPKPEGSSSMGLPSMGANPTGSESGDQVGGKPQPRSRQTVEQTSKGQKGGQKGGRKSGRK